MIAAFEKLLDAEVSAREQKRILESQLTIARAKITGLTIFSIVIGISTLITIPLTVYLWMFGPDEYCAVHSPKSSAWNHL